MIKALALLSGGLDSSLAAWLIKKQKIYLEGLTFKSYFFGPQKGIAAAEQLEIPHRVIDFSEEHLEIVKKPKYGYGKAINPCIDCHALMLKKAKEILEKEGFDFVVTGEVLGQRPFSQNKHSLSIVAQESGLGQRLLRPLSAKLLPPTLPEKKGWVDRNQLLDIQGKSRKRQMALAQKIGLRFPQPAGGCLLTEIEFGRKLETLIKQVPNFDGNDVALLKIGRHYWQGQNRIILGRDQQENENLIELARHQDVLLQPANFIGPTTLVRGNNIKQEVIQQAKQLILSHTPTIKKKLRREPIIFFGSSQESVMVLKALLKAEVPIAAVITKPDRPAGRGQKLTPTPVAQFSQEKDLKLFKWPKLNQETLKETQKVIREKPVLGIVAVYGNLIPRSWLAWCHPLINLHPSLLPKWRGAAPVIRAIEAGDKITGLTIFKIVEAMDAGPTISRVKTRVKPNETAGELTKRLFQIGAKELIKILKTNVFSPKPSFWLMKPQDSSRATLAVKIDKKEAEIDWSQPEEVIERKIRAFNPFPGAYTWIDLNNQKKRLKIWQAHLENNQLIPDIVQLEGKKPVSWYQFQQAYPAIKLPPPEKQPEESKPNESKQQS